MKRNGVLAGALLAFLSLASAGPVPFSALFIEPQCKKDDCLRAAAFGKHKRGPGECKGYMGVTVIPEKVIQTSTAYITRTSTAVDTVLVTSTLATITSNTATTTTMETSTTDTTMITVIKRATAENQPITKSKTEVPRYASVCDNMERYESACSCVGHTRTTTTLATPTSVTVVTSHIYKTTSTQTTLVVTGTTTVDGVVTSTVVTDTAATQVVPDGLFFSDNNGKDSCLVFNAFRLQVFVDDPDFENVNGTYSGRYGQEEMYFYLTDQDSPYTEDYIRDQYCGLAYDYHTYSNGTQGNFTGPSHQNVATYHPNSRAHVVNGSQPTNKTLPARSRLRLEPDGSGRVVIDDKYGDPADESIMSAPGQSYSPSSSSSSASSFSHDANPNELPRVEFGFFGNDTANIFQALAKVRGLDWSDTKLQVDKEGGLYVNPVDFDSPDYADAILAVIDIPYYGD